MFPIRDSIPTQRFPYVNCGLIVINILVFIFIQPLGGSPAEQSFFMTWGLVPGDFSAGGTSEYGYFPFLTNMFLHGGWLHLIGNVWTLYIFGDNVEDRMGPVSYLIFYLLCGLAGGFAHLFTNLGAMIPAVGASGAISGVMGAYLFLCPRSRIQMLIPIFYIPFFFRIPAWVYLGYWILIQVVNGTMELAQTDNGQGGVAFWAHIGGFIGGILLFRLFTQTKYERPAQYSTFKRDPQTMYIRDRGIQWRDNKW